MRWKFWKKVRATRTQAQGRMRCVCGAAIDVSVEAIVAVPPDRFLQPMTTMVQGVPCPACPRTYAINLKSGGRRK